MIFMTKVPSLSLGAAVCTLLASTFFAASPIAQTPAAPPAQQAPAAGAPDPGAALFARMCSDCHDSDRIVGMRRTKTDWEDVINKMIEKGATGSEKDFEGVFAYLLRNYGKVYINTAVADEIATITGLSKKDAEAIVTYRKANGPFADFDAIKKVPDIDVKVLDAHKDAVAF